MIPFLMKKSWSIQTQKPVTDWFFSLILFCQIGLLSTSAHAFINIESLRQNVKPGFAGSTGVTLSGATGNVKVSNIGVTSQNIFKDHEKEYLVIANYNYGESKGVPNNNTGNFHLRYAQGFSPNWAWEIFTQAEFNQFQALVLRKLAGGGLRTRLYKTTTDSLFLGFGAFYEDEKISIDADQANPRSNLYISYRSLFNDHLEGVLTAYYQVKYKVISDYRIQLKGGIESTLTETLQLVNNFSYSLDTRPPRTIQTQDFTYKVVLNWSY